MTRVAIFVDGANMFYAQRSLGWFIDWKALLHRLIQERTLYNAFYYTAVNPKRPNDEGFYRYLTHVGYTVRRKALKRIHDPEGGQYIEKANLDIEMVVDMFNTIPLYDEAVLCTGDSDFERAIELLRSKGKVITVLSTLHHISLELRNAADRYVDVAEWRPWVERELPEAPHVANGIGMVGHVGMHPPDPTRLIPGEPGAGGMEPPRPRWRPLGEEVPPVPLREP